MTHYISTQIRSYEAAGFPATTITALIVQAQLQRESDGQLCSRCVPAEDFNHGALNGGKHYQKKLQDDGMSSFSWGIQKKVILS